LDLGALHARQEGIARVDQNNRHSHVPYLHCAPPSPAATCFACHCSCAESRFGQQQTRLHRGSCAGSNLTWKWTVGSRCTLFTRRSICRHSPQACKQYLLLGPKRVQSCFVRSAPYNPPVTTSSTVLSPTIRESIYVDIKQIDCHLPTYPSLAYKHSIIHGIETRRRTSPSHLIIRNVHEIRLAQLHQVVPLLNCTK